MFLRRVSAGRMQLIMLIIDFSGSMIGDKILAAIAGVQEMLYRCQTVGPEGVSLFRLSIIGFSDEAWRHPVIDRRAVWEIDPDQLSIPEAKGGTNMAAGMMEAEKILRDYNRSYLANHPEPERHPLPLILFFSDGANGYANPLPVADRIKKMSMAGGHPIIVTAGVSADGGTPDVELLQALATFDTETRTPCYFDVTDSASLARFLADVGSSGASTPRAIFQAFPRLPSPDSARRLK